MTVIFVFKQFLMYVEESTGFFKKKNVFDFQRDLASLGFKDRRVSCICISAANIPAFASSFIRSKAPKWGVLY